MFSRLTQTILGAVFFGLALALLYISFCGEVQQGQAADPPTTAEFTVQLSMQPDNGTQVCFEATKVIGAPDPGAFCLSHGGSQTFSGLIPGAYAVEKSNTSSVWGVLSIGCSPNLPGTGKDVSAGVLVLNLEPGDATTCIYTVEFGVQPTQTPLPSPTRTPRATETHTPVVVTATPSPTPSATPTAVVAAQPAVFMACANGIVVNLTAGGQCVAPVVQPAQGPLTGVFPATGGQIIPPKTGDAGLVR